MPLTRNLKIVLSLKGTVSVSSRLLNPTKLEIGLPRFI